MFQAELASHENGVKPSAGGNASNNITESYRSYHEGGAQNDRSGGASSHGGGMQ